MDAGGESKSMAVPGVPAWVVLLDLGVVSFPSLAVTFGNESGREISESQIPREQVAPDSIRVLSSIRSAAFRASCIAASTCWAKSLRIRTI